LSVEILARKGSVFPLAEEMNTYQGHVTDLADLIFRNLIEELEETGKSILHQEMNEIVDFYLDVKTSLCILLDSDKPDTFQDESDDMYEDQTWEDVIQAMAMAALKRDILEEVMLLLERRGVDITIYPQY